VTSVPGSAAAASFPIRPATHADVDAMTDALTTAFFNDPVWGPVFPDESRRAAQSAVMWRAYAASALRYPWTFVTPAAEAAAIWIPPGGVELTDEEEHGLAGLLEEAGGPEVAAAAGEVDARLVAAEPCFHLTIIGTHIAHRGRGLGMGLLAATLSRIDALGAPAYLESTNPANDKRYQRVGFEPRGEIVMPAGQIVTTMWRSPRPA
jgi:GNAT superfamily N-acetyltransferase